MDKIICVSTGIITFLVLAYCCIGVDYISSYITEDVVNHPISRLIVLALMAVAFCYDPYLSIVIGFAYLLTKLSLNTTETLDIKPMVLNIQDNEDTPSKTYEKEEEPQFTSKEQFKSAQSNVFSDDAMLTEVRTWVDGYGTQSNLVKK
tara:strand:- start:1444 stop:1887 length:444 start_codon:yes stop_codon:yes gene_type:complete